MGNAIDHETLHVWRHLAKDGGWWTASLLTSFWRPTFAQDEIQRHLEALNAAGFLSCRSVPGRRHDLEHVQYAFTSECNRLEELAS